MRHRSAVAVGAAALAASGVVGVLVLRHGGAMLPGSEGCEARVGETVVQLDLEQAQNAALIAAVGVRRELPARATSIALAAAYQESKITNLDYGDRDSVGLFQQRPSQGWGTREEILDPYHATEAFYDALAQVDGYESMPIHRAAQEVQRSADGSAYEQHETSARALASALSGYSDAAFSCRVDPPADSGQEPRDDGLTANASAVVDDVREAFGPLSAEGVDGGRAVDFPVGSAGNADTRRGWALAHYLVANADRLAVRTVIFDDRIWSASRSDEGWREYEAPDSAGDPDMSRHLDHVHVAVA